MKMRSRLFVIFLFAVFIFSSSCCAISSEIKRSEYDVLCSAVSASSYAVIGEYGASIPSDFTVDKFTALVEKNIPEDYFKVLKQYILEIKPKGSYYLLLVFDPDTKKVILFDYSCSPEPDGPVLIEPGKFDLNNLDLYDTCKAKN
jgi:hypothetical protein